MKQCPKCKQQVEIITEMRLYNRVHDGSKYIGCYECNLYVKLDKRTGKPLGYMADRKTRLARKEAHKYLDKVWRDGILTRDEAYQYLRDNLHKSRSEGHIAKLNKTECDILIKVLKRDFYEGGI